MSKLGNFTRSKPGRRHTIAATNPTCSHSSDWRHCDAVAMNGADWRKRRIGCWMVAIPHGLPPTLPRQPPSPPAHTIVQIPLQLSGSALVWRSRSSRAATRPPRRRGDQVHTRLISEAMRAEWYTGPGLQWHAGSCADRPALRPEARFWLVLPVWMLGGCW